MNRFTSLAILALVGLVACTATAPSISTSHDPVDKIDSMNTNACRVDDLSTGIAMAVNVSLIKKDGTETWGIIVSYSASDWLFMDRATFRVGDRVIRLGTKPSTPTARQVLTGRISESMWLDATPEIINTLANSPGVLIKVSGSKGYVTAKLSESGRATWCTFIERYGR